MNVQLIESVEQAFEVLGISPDLGTFNQLNIPQADIQPLADLYQLIKIVEASNKLNGFVADWSNNRQYKYSCYFYTKADASKPSGFGFSFTLYASWYTNTTVGSRLSVGTSEEAMHIGKTFGHLFESFMFINKNIVTDEPAG